MKKKNKKLFLFDLDGVLVDSKKNMEKSWSMVNKKFKYNKNFKQYFSKIGIPFEKILFKLNIKRDLENAKLLYQKTSIKNEKLIRLYPKVKKILKLLIEDGNKVGIVTSKDKKRSLKIIKKFKLKFSTVQCPEKNIKGKPNKDLIIRALAKTGFKNIDTYYIGDTNIDYITSKRANVNFIFAKYGYGRLKNKPHYSIKKISDLIKLIKSKKFLEESL